MRDWVDYERTAASSDVQHKRPRQISVSWVRARRRERMGRYEAHTARNSTRGHASPRHSERLSPAPISGVSSMHLTNHVRSGEARKPSPALPSMQALPSAWHRAVRHVQLKWKLTAQLIARRCSRTGGRDVGGDDGGGRKVAAEMVEAVAEMAAAAAAMVWRRRRRWRQDGGDGGGGDGTGGGGDGGGGDGTGGGGDGGGGDGTRGGDYGVSGGCPLTP
eukprot:CAMPEP_0181227938 /NCGR_PEP_ID=MMETSP1096-20121128/33069_1 /TAXON_ID=156174 ORGANISM="Chrysochromulina ericina, Strain CCMP281" /NCGR_SAMPLE_ID=MMETSP1096 /ASSEMBLY_ACC=CAM_ASM_000453 /LENGTH=218 /DNA_ID=CAMNT_0023321405 /DNA_START=28 /DNA_END=685 /DNA_ORIENTATION=-